MNVGELRERLEALDDSMEVVILDGNNGFGDAREINLGPIVEDDSCGRSRFDIDTKKGDIAIMGYGFY